MPTARPPWCARRCAISRRRSIACRCSCWPPGRRPPHSHDWSRTRRSCSSRSTPPASARSPPSTPRPARRRCPSRRCWPRAAGSHAQVHEAAAEWARREATRGVDATAGRAAAGRGEARALEEELAGSVVELQSARERAGLVRADGDVAVAPAVCPYKGLAPFDAADAEYFFGRERLVAELVARLVGAPLLAVVGPSGSGKSSVLRAGLLPALAGGVLPGSDGWTQALIRPGEQPLRELGRATRRLAREWRRVLAVDQFEELFTACQDETERAEFVAGPRACRAR